jgi:hypothetical protein
MQKDTFAASTPRRLFIFPANILDAIFLNARRRICEAGADNALSNRCSSVDVLNHRADSNRLVFSFLPSVSHNATLSPVPNLDQGVMHFLRRLFSSEFLTTCHAF